MFGLKKMKKNITWKEDFVSMINIKNSSYIFVGLILLFSALLDYMLLTFAYRDFSWWLVIMFIYAPLGIIFGFNLLLKQLKTMIIGEKI